MNSASDNDLLNRIGTFDADQSLIESTVEIGQSVGIEPELLQNRGVNPFDMHAIFDRGRSQLIGFAKTDSAFDSATGQPHRKPIGIVIPARSFFILGGRLASKLASPDDQRFIKQPALLQIRESGPRSASLFRRHASCD